MLAKAIIRDIMDRNGIGMVKMAKMLGFAYPQKVTDRLGTSKSKNLSTDKLDEMLRVLGYKAIIVPEDVVIREGWYEIEDSNSALVGTDEEKEEDI